MFLSTAKKILQKNKISFFNRKIHIRNNEKITPEIIKAVNTLYRKNQSFYHPFNSTIYTGSKTTSVWSNRKIQSIDFVNIQNKSYEVYLDSLFAQSLIHSMETLTVGAGLRLQSTPSTTLLYDVDNLFLTRFSEMAQELWGDFVNDDDCDYNLDQTYNQIEALRAKHLFVFGEYFYIRRVGYNNQPLTLQLIDPRNVQNPESIAIQKVKDKGGDVINGIEVDKVGTKKAIYIKNKKTNNQYEYVRVPFYNKNGMKQVAHSYRQHVDMFETRRGMPLIGLAIHEILKMTDADLLEMDSMAVNASIAAFVTSNQGYESGDVLGSQENDFQRYDTSGTLIERTEDQYSTVRKNVTQGGMILQNLPPGVSINAYDTKRPNVNLNTYLNSKMEYIAPATAGISLEIVKQLFGQNFSASRASTDLSWKTFNFYNKVHFARDNQLDYRLFIEWYVARGILTAPGWDIAYKKKAWSKAVWHGQAKPTFNPQQEANASAVLIEQGLSTRESESQRFSGTSFNQNILRLEKENEELGKANEKIKLEKNIQKEPVVV